MALAVRCRTLTVGLILIAILFWSCTTKRGDPGPITSPTPPLVSTTPPFKTKEPNTYQAIRSVTFSASSGGDSVVTTTSIARDGELRRSEENSGGKLVVYLDLADRSFVLLPQEKIYAEAAGTPLSSQPSETADGPDEIYLHTAPIQSTYENLGTETINGQNSSKYRVVVKNSSDTTVNETETLIWIDDSLGIPVKSVTRSAAGTRTMELSSISLTADRHLFEIPKDYQKVEPRVLRQRIR